MKSTRPVRSKKPMYIGLESLGHLPVIANMGIRLRHPFKEKGISVPKEIGEITTIANATRIPYDRNGEKTPELLENSFTQEAVVWGVFVGNPRTLIYSPVSPVDGNSEKIRQVYMLPIDQILDYKRAD